MRIKISSTTSSPPNQPGLSLILCSRNDHYMGNSPWRLETTLNYVAQIVQNLGREKDVELIVADWGSEVPLREVVQLTPAAASIVSFIHVPAGIARDLQKDSAFPEVLALNAAARRSKGEYIGRIDQDTLVGECFFRNFFDMREGELELRNPMATTLFFSGRRSIPYRLASLCPPLWKIARVIQQFGRFLKIEKGPRWAPFYVCSVGIWLAHRKLWHECGGYDERMVYMGGMEGNMIARLMKKYPMVDLGKIVGYDFYHLEHYHPWVLRAPWANRPGNDDFYRRESGLRLINPNGGSWGFRDYQLDRTYPSRGSRTKSEVATQSRLQLPYTFWIFSVGAQIFIENFLLWLRNLPRCIADWGKIGWHRATVVWATVRGRPLSLWPQALKSRWMEKEREESLIFPENIIKQDVMKDHKGNKSNLT
jgi:hypothetical protein